LELQVKLLLLLLSKSIFFLVFVHKCFVFIHKKLLVSLPLVGCVENKGKNNKKRNCETRVSFVLNGFRISSLFDF
jgi:hypothetical protein